MIASAAHVELPKEGDKLLEKYVLEKPLGQGGMGIVYAARHELLGQRVAVKFLLPEVASNGDAVARFLNEARAASRIESDHVARVLDVGLVQGALPYMVLEFLDGDDLAVVLEKRGPLAPKEAADYLLEAIEALAHAHVLGIVHRDLKPSNLFLVRRRDGSARVKVLDFGISKLMDPAGLGSSNLTKTNAILGSPLYMSPEQLRDSKSVDHRCDIWALGVIGYELLTGHPPFMAENAVALFAAIQETEPMSLRARRPDGSIPPELERAVLRCLRRNPNERYTSVSELGAALAPFGTEAGTRAFENAKRILPLSAALGAPAAPAITANSAVTPFTSDRTVSATSAAYVNTAEPWSSPQGPPSPPKSKRAALLGLAALGALSVGAVLVGAHYFGARGAEQAAAAPSVSALPANASTSSNLAPSSTLAPTVSASPSSLAVPAASPSPALAAPSASVTHAAPTPRPKSALTSALPPTARPRPSAHNCDPPYTVDSVGHHVLKPGCE